MSIFISIASYRDELLKTTITSAYENAKYKNLLVFGICEQSYEDEAIDISSFSFSNQIKYIRIDPHLSKGCAWARNLVQTMYHHEEYYLQIDAHTIFDENWDDMLINQLLHLLTYHNKPLLTAYPPSFEIHEDNFIREKRKLISGLVAKTISEENNSYIIKQDYSESSQSIASHGFLLAGGFIFTLGKIVIEAPWDPNYFFSEEELAHAIRFWTSGFNLFHPMYIPLYHLYGISRKTLFWNDDKANQLRNEKWVIHSDQGQKRLVDFIENRIDGLFGFGSKRTLAQYEKWSGIHFSTKTLNENAKSGSVVFNIDYTIDPLSI